MTFGGVGLVGIEEFLRHEELLQLDDVEIDCPGLAHWIC